MGLQQSKESALYLQAVRGNVDGIRALHWAGAGLEWVDEEGRTPLILACVKPDGFQVVKALLELGANIDAYRSGPLSGTPLHHAAKTGHTQMVNLLLSHGANVCRLNDDSQTALDLARAKGHSNVVRAIENHMCLFSGWLRELYGPGFLEVLAPKLISRKIWAVVLPQDNQNSLMSSQRLELAIYPTLQVAQPQTIIDLQKVVIEDVNFDLPDPVVIITDKFNKKHFKFSSASEGDQQLLRFYSACKGIIVQHTVPEQARRDGSTMMSTGSASQTVASPPASEDTELAMAISASIQSAIAEGARHASTTPFEPQNNNTSKWDNSEDTSSYNGWAPTDQSSASLDATNGWADEVQTDQHNGRSLPESEPITSSQNHETKIPTVHQAVSESDLYSGWAAQESQPRPTASQNITPSAPPVREDTFTSSAVHYPSVDFSPIDMPSDPKERREAAAAAAGGGGGTCVVCLDAKVEGACIPCGHMAGCISCLNEIKSKGWGCPVCRAKIDQVLKLYSV